jgi:hypothetical protein
VSLSELAKRTKGFRAVEREQSSTVGDPLPVPATTLELPAPAHGLRIAFIPDTQVRKGVPIEHIIYAGRYIAQKRPDVIVIIGDWWDFPSLSKHSQPGSLAKENARYIDDLNAGREAMELFMNEIEKAAGYRPVLIFCLGNHEYRAVRRIDDDPVLQGVISLDHLRLADYGFKVYPFLQPVTVGGVAFSHFFPSGVMGRAITKPHVSLRTLHMSTVAGHLQGRETAYARRADGTQMTAIISGSFYQHNEEYLSPLTNIHWRGMWMLHEVKNGSFDEMAVSINFLKRKFQ